METWNPHGNDYDDCCNDPEEQIRYSLHLQTKFAISNIQIRENRIACSILNIQLFSKHQSVEQVKNCTMHQSTCKTLRANHVNVSYNQAMSLVRRERTLSTNRSLVGRFRSARSRQ